MKDGSTKTGVINAAAPIGTKVSNTLLPKILPMEILFRLLMMARNEMANSGKLVPGPMIITAITDWETSND